MLPEESLTSSGEESEVKHYLLMYIYVSLTIGLLNTLATLYRLRRTLYEERGARERVLDELAEKGHIQKETSGERNVYYRKDLFGEANIKSANWLDRIKKENRGLFLLVFFVVGVIATTVEWPRMLYNFITKKK